MSTTPIRMLDAAFPPTTPAGFQTLREHTGASAFAFYVPNWGAPYQAANPGEVRAANITGNDEQIEVVIQPSTQLGGMHRRMGKAFRP